MTHISELVDTDALAAAVDARLVRSAKHPSLPVTVHKYTESCVYTGAWDEVTRLCRGLVVADDGTVLARPFSKFFNIDEVHADTIDPDEPVAVTDKVDGSMGAAWELDGQWYISTPGSADSLQAREGTRMLREHTDFDPLPGTTYVFEVVYPGSKVVVNYDFTGLVLLAGVDIATGDVTEAVDLPGWSGRRVQTLPHATLREALAAEPRPNAEGLVVRTPDGRAVKVKQADYVRLHRLVTGLTDRRVAEMVLSGGLDAVMMHLPEEFHPAIEKVAVEARLRFDTEVARLVAVHDSVPDTADQRARAEWVKANVDAADRWVAFRPDMVDVTDKVAKAVVLTFEAEVSL